MRRISREYVFKLVFEFTFYGERNDDTLDLFLTDCELTDEDKDYIRNFYRGITSQADALKVRSLPWSPCCRSRSFFLEREL